MLRLIYRWLKAGYLWEGKYHDTDAGSPQGGVLSPLLANVYLHSFDKAFKQQKSFIGYLTRYADDFVIQCGSEEDARKALEWAEAYLSKLKLRIRSYGKTRIVNDREDGFDFLGFHHRRVVLQSVSRTGERRESYGGSGGWPAKKAQEKFRAQIRLRLGPPGCLRPHWKDVLEGLRQYVTGWCQYFRHGQSTEVFRKLDYFVHIRVARNLARAQPKAKHRKRRLWSYYAKRLTDLQVLPRLMTIKTEAFRAYRGRAKVSWRAV